MINSDAVPMSNPFTEEAVLRDVSAIPRGDATHSETFGLARMPLTLGPPLLTALDPSLPRLSAVFFGSFSLYREGSRLSIDHKVCCLELCRYLIVKAGQLIPRDELVELLWPDGDVSSGRHRLHVTVSNLRRIIDVSRATESVIHLRGESYGIATGAIDTDYSHFERAYALGISSLSRGDIPGADAALMWALNLYASDFLTDHPYAAWTQAPREHLREHRLTSLAILCEHALARSDLFTARDLAATILADDDMREQAHRQLMRTYYLMGERGLAMRQFDICATILNRELGVLPSLPTTHLRDAIKADEALPSEPPFCA